MYDKRYRTWATSVLEKKKKKKSGRGGDSKQRPTSVRVRVISPKPTCQVQTPTRARKFFSRFLFTTRSLNHGVMDKVPDVPDEAACREAVAQLFPGLCEEYLARIGNELGWVQDAVVNLILDQVEYPKQRTAKKRKADDAELDPAEEFGDPKKRFEGKNRRFQVDYGRAARDLLKHDFPEAYARHVDLVFSENYDCLYASYQELHSCFSKHAAAPDAKRYPRKQVPGNLAKQAREQLAELAQRQNEGTVQALKEYHAVRRSCALRDEEAENLAVAKAQRTTHECAICCEEVALNRTAHCPDGHVFCRGCVRNLASSQVSVGRHGLQCMALDAGCTAVFSHEQRALCLDAKLMMALDRLEAASALAAVEIENLASCPFCPYAEECPPVEEDSEFRCSGCAVVSCRKCKLETHLPNTCAEAAKERGISARHELEEAMTQAMMRKCNNCMGPPGRALLSLCLLSANRRQATSSSSSRAAATG